MTDLESDIDMQPLRDGELYAIEVEHIYQVRAQGRPPRHACMQEGFWCPQNALLHPQDIIKYLRKKL